MSFLTSQSIDAAVVAESVHTDSHGAVVSFAGVVRNHDGGRAVVALGYVAYDSMAEAVCGEIVAEAIARWPVRVALQHRVGDLLVGDTAIVVATGAAHRAEAFAACTWVVDEVKRRVPIWKRERYADGSELWVDPTANGVGPTAPR
jgi:molybdopterin synthase catalytic subunit